MKVEPVVLEGELVRLEPLRADHLPALIEVGMDPVIWKWTNNVVNSGRILNVTSEDALTMAEAGTALPFVTISKADDKVVGSTRFGNIDTGKSKGRDRLDVDKSQMAADGDQYRGKAADADSCI